MLSIVLSEGAAVLCFFGVLSLWTISVLGYRWYFHPLAKFPGPWLAKSTYFYEIYFDIWLGGQYTWKIKELHAKYGPVVRTNPDELHFDDPDYYDEIYNITNAPIKKPFKEANMFGPLLAAIGTVDHDLHRVRRAALNPFFSKRSVNELVPFLQPSIEKLCERFDRTSENGGKINLKYAFNALTTDNMFEYCFSKCSDRVLLPDYDQRSLDNVDKFLVVSLLDWLNRKIAPATAEIFDLREDLSARVEEIRSGRDRDHESSGHRTIFHDLISEKSGLPESEKQRLRLRDEALSLVLAGSGSTAHTLKVLMYHIAANPAVREKLYACIKTVMPDRTSKPKLVELEQVPYLTAVISEGLRVAHPITHRMRRAFPKKAIKYGDYIVPPGTSVSMTSILIHENEDIFPEPKVFKPERWLESGQIQKRLIRYLTPFSRGSRGCLGINLAWAELYIITAVMVRRYEFDISEVVRERDIDCTRDMILGATAVSSQGALVGIRMTE